MYTLEQLKVKFPKLSESYLKNYITDIKKQNKEDKIQEKYLIKAFNKTLNY